MGTNMYNKASRMQRPDGWQQVGCVNERAYKRQNDSKWGIIRSAKSYIEKVEKLAEGYEERI